MNSIANRLFDAAWSGRLRDIESIFNSSKIVPAQAIGSALEAAAYNAQPEVCEFLLKHGADPNTFNKPTGETVLHQTITKTTSTIERTRILKSLMIQ